VLPLTYKPAHSLGDLLEQHPEDTEQEAEDKGGMQAVQGQHFVKVYQVRLALGTASMGLAA
jgi:hypothetical protein